MEVNVKCNQLKRVTSLKNRLSEFLQHPTVVKYPQYVFSSK